MASEVLYLHSHPEKSNYNRSQLFAKVSSFIHWYKYILVFVNMFWYQLFFFILRQYGRILPVPVAVRSKGCVCGRRSFARVANSNPADVRLLCLLRRQRPLRWADHSYRGDLPAVCVCTCDLETSPIRRPRTQSGCWTTEKMLGYLCSRLREWKVVNVGSIYISQYVLVASERSIIFKQTIRDTVNRFRCGM